MTIQAPKGVPEYVPPQGDEFRYVRDQLATPAILAGYKYIELPYFEDVALYTKGIGESTDVVSKEMYTFTDRGDRQLALRPEGTAGVIRSVIENNLTQNGLPIKIWYAGAFFRAERPQKGRYRQLQQVGIEAIGAESPALDAEVIALGYEAFLRIGLTKFEIQLTSLGDTTTRPHYREVLTSFLSKLDLDSETQERVKLNPLRVLDDKRPEIQKQLVDAPLMINYLSDESKQYHESVKHYLLEAGIPFVDAPRLVRGLDYYTRTTFEFVHSGLGAQSGIGGGGRYDQLMGSLGGKDVSGIGFGLGVDRAYLACEAEGIDIRQALPKSMVLLSIGETHDLYAFKLAQELRANGFIVDYQAHAKNLKSGLKNADRLHAAIAILVGDDEVAANSVSIRMMDSGEQIMVLATNLILELSNRLTLGSNLWKEA
jgi:histidyl-tRNA synthetase